MGLKESGLRGSLRSVSTGVGIPDSVVSRDRDDSSFDRDAGEVRGQRVDLKTSWRSIGAKISDNTSGVTQAELLDDDDNVINTVNISDLSAGDAFTFDNVELSEGVYEIIVGNPDSSWTNGGTQDVDYPYTTKDIDIISTADGRTDFATAVNDIGNVGFD